MPWEENVPVNANSGKISKSRLETEDSSRRAFARAMLSSTLPSFAESCRQATRIVTNADCNNAESSTSLHQCQLVQEKGETKKNDGGKCDAER